MAQEWQKKKFDAIETLDRRARRRALGGLVRMRLLANGSAESFPPATFRRQGRPDGILAGGAVPLQHAVALDPNDARAHNDLAIALEAIGEFGAAFDEYKKALSLAGNDKSIKQNYTKFAEFYTAYTKRVGKVNPAP